MIEFFRLKGTNILRVWECSSAGRKRAVKAVIGQAGELNEREIIFSDNVKGNENKWLAIVGKENGEIHEFESLDAAKDFCREKFE
jgi:hypothetical protein